MDQVNGRRSGASDNLLTRRVLLLRLGIAAIAPVLVACGGEQPPAPSAASAPSSTSSAAASRPASSSATSSAATSAASSSATASTTSVATSAATKPAATKFGPGTTLRIVQGSHFVPAYDKWLDKFVVDWGKANGVQASIDHVPGLQIPAVLAAEAAAGSGHDIVQVVTTVPHLFASNFIDVGDIVEAMGKKYGGWLQIGEDMGKINGVWRCVPDFWIVNALIWRTDLFEQNGLKAPETWDDLINAAKVLKPKRHQTGIAISHCNDGNLFWRAFMWSHGASINDKEGNTYVNTKELREVLARAYEFWRDGMTDEVFSWDDASDNRLLDSGVAGFIQDAISAYRSASPRLQNVMKVGLPVKGPAGAHMSTPYQVYGIWKFSKNIDAAKEFLVALKDNWKEAAEASLGYNMPYNKDMLKKPMPVLGSDPKLEVLQDAGPLTHSMGYPGPVTTAAGAVYANFLLPDTIARVTKGGGTSAAIEDAIKWLEEQMTAIDKQFPRK